MGSYRYEAMLVVDGDLKQEEARDSIKNLLSLFEGLKDYAETVKYSDNLAYAIKKRKTCHRFIINFELGDPLVLAEFNRLALLNKNLLRHLVINLTKDRSARALKNPKKLKDSAIRKEKFKQFLEKKVAAAAVYKENANKP